MFFGLERYLWPETYYWFATYSFILIQSVSLKSKIVLNMQISFFKETADVKFAISYCRNISIQKIVAKS